MCVFCVTDMLFAIMNMVAMRSYNMIITNYPFFRVGLTLRVLNVISDSAQVQAAGGSYNCCFVYHSGESEG